LKKPKIILKKERKRSLPIIYLHDFLIEKTKKIILKKERKRSLPIIYLHDFLIEKIKNNIY
jgi:vacuolar-type H+-ATPase subunit F/Vma7